MGLNRASGVPEKESVHALDNDQEADSIHGTVRPQTTWRPGVEQIKNLAGGVDETSRVGAYLVTWNGWGESRVGNGTFYI